MNETEFCKLSYHQKYIELSKRKCEVIEHLSAAATNSKIGIRIMVSKNSNTDKDTVRKLCYDPSVGVRASCAARHGLEADLFYHLAKDKSFEVLHQLTMNKYLPLDLLEPIYFSDCKWKRIPNTHNLMDQIRYHSLRKGMTRSMFDDAFIHCGFNSTIYIQLVLCEFWENKHYDLLLDRNPVKSIICRMARGLNGKETPTSVLERLYEDFGEDANPYLASNKQTPIYILKKLSKHKEDRIVKYARNTLMGLKGLSNFA